jgi:hypothetical protein
MSVDARWRRKLGEATMIVASILLAFWIDAWWVGLEEAEDERESLELVSRDLKAAIVQLTEYAEFAERVGTGATLFMGREYAFEIIEDARARDAEVRRELEAL